MSRVIGPATRSKPIAMAQLEPGSRPQYSGPIKPHKHKDPTNHDFQYYGISVILGLGTRMSDPHVYIILRSYYTILYDSILHLIVRALSLCGTLGPYT